MSNYDSDTTIDDLIIMKAKNSGFTDGKKKGVYVYRRGNDFNINLSLFLIY